MVELGQVQGSLLKQVVDAVRDVVQEANIECSATGGFSLQAMDSSHLAIAAFLLLPNAFHHFCCDRPLTLGVNLNNMATILRCGAPHDIVNLRYGDKDVLTFLFESPTQDKISEYEMKLMVIEAEEFRIPVPEDAVYNAIVKMPSADFARIIRGLSYIGDTVLISVTEQGVVKFAAKGDFDATITWTQNNFVYKPEEETVIEMTEPVSMVFSLRYLNSFTKATSLSKTVTISLNINEPLIVEYNIAEKGYVRFHLAPKVEDEEVQAEETEAQD